MARTTSDGGLVIRVGMVLDKSDLEQIAGRWEQEKGTPAPPVTSRAFQDYCRDMVRAAVGAAGAGGWEEGVV